MNKFGFRLLTAGMMSLMLVLSGCGSDDGGDGGGGEATTTVSGKVTLSSVVSGGSVSFKASQRAKRANDIRKGKARILSKTSSAHSKAGRTAAARNKVQATKAFRKTKLDELAERVISRAATEVTAANVYLFDADHAEWLAPVAEATTTIDGYSLDLYMNAVENGDAYKDGDPIPSGNYTLVAVGKECSDTVLTSADYPFPDPEDAYCNGDSYRYIVGVQAVVEKFQGAKEANLIVQRSDAAPKVVAVMGEKLNALVTNESGEYELADQALNNRVQVVFNMAMRRSKTPNAIKLNDAGGTAVAGLWKMSPDLTIATFYPTANLTTGVKYSVEINNAKVTNYFGKGLANSITASYTTKAIDLLEPEIAADGKFPASKAIVDISTYIMVEFDEPVDTNDMVVFATTKDGTTGEAVNTAGDALGARPAVKPMGNNRYQILPGVPLELDKIYDIELKGVKDLAGNEMTKQAAWNIVTNATSEGVIELTDAEKLDPAKVALANAQANVKRVIGGWVNAINNSDIGMFGSLLADDFTMQYQKENTCDRNEGLQACAFDTNKDSVLDYVEFISFIEGWFNENSQMEFPDPSDTTGATVLKFTGDTDGIFIKGDAKVADGESIDVDVASGSAAFKFNMTYHYGTAETAIVEGEGEEARSREINLFLGLINLNGAWMINSIADREMGAVRDVDSLLPITQVSPIADLAEGTRDLEFTFTPLAAGTVTSYAVLMYDRNDPSDETGWLTVVDATAGTTDIAVNYTQVADKDATDGQVTLVGGGFDSPFERELGALTDGGRYSWTVIGFETLTAADFVVDGGLQKSPEGDMVAWSTPKEFVIGGTFTQDLTVTLATTTADGAAGSALSFSNEYGAWDAGVAANMTLTIVSENGSDGKVFVSGNYYSETSFKFDANGTATVTVPLYEGFNWVEVNVGSNWWFAAYPRNNSVYVEQGGGIKPTEMIVTSVSADGTDLTRNRYGEYVITTMTNAELTVTGTATAGSNLHFDVGGQVNDRPVYDNRVVTVGTDGAFTVNLPVYGGFNWVGVWDDFGNWMDFGIDNQTNTVATYTAPFTGITVTADGLDATLCAAGSQHTLTDGKIIECWNDTYIVDTALDVTVAGVAGAKGGLGHWWTNNMNFGTWFDGVLDIDATSGAFSFPLTAFPGENMVGFEDPNFSMMEIIIVNTNNTVTAPHEITSVFNGATEITKQTYDWGETYYDAGAACSVTINGASSGSAGLKIHGDVFNNGNSEFIEVTADTTGAYSADVNIYSGENWVNMNDARGIWQGTRILTTCADVPVGLELVNVTDGTNALLQQTDQYGGVYWDAVAGNTATLSGTAKSGSEIIIHVNGYDYREKRITVLTDGTWSVTVDLFPQDNWIDIEQGGNWRNTMVRTAGGLDCSMAPCSNQGFGLESAMFIDDIDSISPANGATGVPATATITGHIDLAMFPLFGQEVIRAEVKNYDATQAFFSSDTSEGGNITFNKTTGTYSFSATIAASGAEIYVGVWGNVADSPDFVEPIHGSAIGVNGAVVGPDGGTDGGGGGFLIGASPTASPLTVTGPTHGNTGLTSITVNGTLPGGVPTGTVLRLLVMPDPFNSTGGPSAIHSSDATDQWIFGDGAAFTVDGSGAFSIPLTLDGTTPTGLAVVLYTDKNTDPKDAPWSDAFYLVVNDGVL